MRARTAGLVGVALGLGLVVVGATLLSPLPDAEYTLHSVERTDVSGVDAVRYADLPAAGQRAFRAALDSREPFDLDPARNDQTIQRLRENQAIVYEGAVYEYDLDHADSQSGVGRALIVTTGATLAGIGFLRRLRKQLRPLTTTAAILAGGLPLFMFVGLTIFEGGVQSDIGVRFMFGPALPSSFVAVVTGTAMRRKDTSGAIVSSGLAIGAVLISAVVGQGTPVTLLLLPLLSVPWFGLGYLLSQPAPASAGFVDGLVGHFG